jgi:drug/metabolite transporter (DMT)-like permease
MFANVGLARTSASVASILLALESVFAVLASAWFLGERFRRTDLVGVGLGLAGAIVVATSSDGGTSSMTGNAFVVLSALAAAGFFVVSRRAGAAMPVADLVARQGLVGLLVVLPYAAWVWFHQGSSLLTSGAGPIALGLLAGLIGYVVPMTLWMQVAHRLPAGFAAVALYVVPVAGVGSSALLGRGGLDLASATGGILVLVALAVLGLHGRAPEVTVADGDGGADRQAWSNERTADSMPPDEGSMVSAAR